MELNLKQKKRIIIVACIIFELQFLSDRRRKNRLMQLGEKGRRFSRHDLVFDLQTVRAFRQKGKIFISPPPSISHCNWYCLRETNANTFERRKTRKQIESPGLLPRSERSSKELDLVSTSTSAIIKSFVQFNSFCFYFKRRARKKKFPKERKILLTPTLSTRNFIIDIVVKKNIIVFEYLLRGHVTRNPFSKNRQNLFSMKWYLEII